MGAPSFIGVGMQKSGTRWLYQQLKHHPDFWMPPVKEFHFFDAKFPSKASREVVVNPKRVVTPADHAFARRLLALETRKDHELRTYFDLFEPAAGKLTGEITPEYAALSAEQIGQLARAMPDTKIILMVRDPVARAWSALNDAANSSRVDPMAVINPETMIETLKRHHFAQVSFPSDAFIRWSSIFPTRYFFLEDVATDPEKLRSEIFAYFGATLDPPLTLPASYNDKAGRRRVPMTEPLRTALIDHFGQELLRCAEMFGGPANAWPKNYGIVSRGKAAETQTL